jgi:hypothetical protein
VAANGVLQSLTTAFDNGGVASDFIKFMGLVDNFLRNTTGKMDSSGYQNLIKYLGPNQEAKASFFDSNGTTLYLNICSFLKAKRSDIITLVTKMGKDLEPTNQKIETDNKQLKKLPETTTQILLRELDENIRQYESVEKIYKTVFNATFNYPDYEVKYYDNYNPVESLQFSDDRKYDKYKFDILRNNTKYFSVEDYDILDKELSNYINNDLKIHQTNPNKKDVFNEYIRKNINKDINVRAITGITSSVTYEDITKELIHRTFQSINNKHLENNPFLSKYVASPARTEKGKDKNGNEQTIEVPASYKPFTDYMMLVLDGVPTPDQKRCGVRPHYLDIDEVKSDAVKNKANSLCIEELVNEKVKQNLPVDTEELESLERTDTQNILLTSAHTITLRMYIHDILLRGIGVFGYYDPQFLRDDKMFVDYIANAVESEIRGVDDTYYNLLTTFLVDQYNLNNPKDLQDKQDNKARKNIFVRAVKNELAKSCLPKMTKRILDDTNQRIAKERGSITNSPVPDFVISLKRFSNLRQMINVLKLSKIILENTKDPKNPYVYISLNNRTLKLFNGNIDSITEDTVEYRLMFEYLFPIKKYITTLFIINVLSTSTRRQVLDIFKGTKAALRTTAKSIYSNGQPIVPNSSNPQDVVNSSEGFDMSSFILEAVFTAPLKIVKGYAEASDPNVALTSGIYKLGKLVQPDLPSYLIPAAGVPLGVASIFIPPMLPFAMNIVNSFYYGAGLWAEGFGDDLTKKKEAMKKFTDSLLEAQTITGELCENVKNHSDVLKFDDKKYVKTSNQ